MNQITGVTRDGAIWIPEFVVALDQKKCIGCGRCFKICPRDVLDLVERSEDMELADDDDDDDDNASVMSIADAGDCIGCGACGRTCPKGCYSYATADAIAAAA